MQVVCKNCVMDVTAKEIVYDKDGICNWCNEYQDKAQQRRAEKLELPWVFNEMRKSKGEYDCILGMSGGVDSSMCLHYLKQNGIKVYAFSVDNGWNTRESDENIMRLVEGLKVPFYRYTLDLEIFKKLQRAFLKSGTKNVEIPTDHILTAATYEMAKKYKIKWIVSGGNYQTESIMPKSWGYQARDLTHIKAIYKQFMGTDLKGLPTMSLPEYIINRFIKKIKIVNLLDYYDYNRADSIKLLNEKYGYKDYGEKHNESTYTQWFQNWYLPTRFNIDKRKAHYSSMILSGQMKRSDALDRLIKLPEFPFFGLEDKVLKVPKKSYKDYPNSEKAWDRLSKIYAYIK
tara:strand:- start:486 stop:1517 length:1032 start_codon:yes stop_codon:yes gene_type:complete